MPALRPWIANLDLPDRFGILWIVLFFFGMATMALYAVSQQKTVSPTDISACEMDARLYNTADSIAITQWCVIESEIKQDLETMRNSACAEHYTKGLCDSIITYVTERAQKRSRDIELFKMDALRRSK
jgi:hypothetical protein